MPSPQATADVVAAQQERIIPALKPMFEWDDGLFGKIATKQGEVVSSRSTRITLQTRTGGRSGAVNLAGGVLGRGGAGRYDVATLTPRSARHALEINYDAIRQTRGEPVSVFGLLKREIANAMTEFRKFFDRQLQTAGDGILATVSAVSTDEITCDNAPFYVQLLSEGQVVAVYDTTLATNRGTAEIDTIEGELNLFNFATGTTPAGTVATDEILPEGLTGASPAWYFGLPYHIDSSATGTWLGLNRANVPRIRSHTVNAASGALSHTYPRTLLDKVRQRVGLKQYKKSPYLWHMHPAQTKAWEDLAILIQRYDIGGGNKSVDLLPWDDFRISGVKTFENIHAARNRLDLLNMNNWGKVESDPINWYSEEGKRIFHPVDSTTGSPVAAYLMYLIAWLEFFDVQPPGEGAVTSLAIPSGYDLLS
jgi:hypothetical protein